MTKKILIGLVGFAITFMACYAADVYYNKNIHADNITELSDKIDSTSDRTSVLEEKTGTWGAEEWTFVTTEGETIGKPVVVSSEENVFWPETCYLYWTISNNTSDIVTYYIPTNFPTKNLCIYSYAATNTQAEYIMPEFYPDSEKHIKLLLEYRQYSTNRYIFEKGNHLLLNLTNTTTGRRLTTFDYDVVSQTWIYNGLTPGTQMKLTGLNRNPTSVPPTYMPSTVEEWKEMWLSRQSSSNN